MNAIVHRDYSIEGMVVVDFDTNKMTITNPGVFYGGVSAENITIHQPRHRNKSLAKLLMSFQLVDRAGMGVRRMGLGSLMYGRQFPSFREAFDTVEVVMSAESIIPEIFVLTQADPESFGIVDLIIFNSIYKTGFVSVIEISKRCKGLVSGLWPAIKDAVNRHHHIELCGTKEGVFIRVTTLWNSYFTVRKSLKIPSTSDKHVKLFDYLVEFGEGSNEDITKLLEHKNATHTSQFLRDTLYAKRKGNGPSARWSLVEQLI